MKGCVYVCVCVSKVCVYSLPVDRHVCVGGWVPVCLGAACVTGRVDAAFDCVYVVNISGVNVFFLFLLFHSCFWIPPLYLFQFFSFCLRRCYEISEDTHILRCSLSERAETMMIHLCECIYWWLLCVKLSCTCDFWFTHRSSFGEKY